MGVIILFVMTWVALIWGTVVLNEGNSNDTVSKKELVIFTIMVISGVLLIASIVVGILVEFKLEEVKVAETELEKGTDMGGSYVTVIEGEGVTYSVRTDKGIQMVTKPFDRVYIEYEDRETAILEEYELRASNFVQFMYYGKIVNKEEYRLILPKE